MVKKQKICIAGKNNIAVNIAEHILLNYENIELIALFNDNDDGNNTFQRSFKRFCNQNNVEEVPLEVIYDDNNLLFLSLEFDKIIKPNLFKSERLFNVHFSSLPKYKGMYTSALPILNGEKESGVTLHRVDRGIDTGDIIAQKNFSIDDSLNSEQLYFKYIDYGTALVIANLESLINCSCKGQTQNSFGSSYFSRKTIDYSNLIINLELTAYQIQRQINAFVFPAYQLPKIFETTVYNTIISSERSIERPGNIIEETKYYFKINTIDYNIFILKDLRVELFKLAELGDIEALKSLMSNGYNIFQRSIEGWDIAIIAAYNGKFAFLDYLIVDLKWNIHTHNNNGTSLAMYIMTYASLNNNVSYLRKFLNDSQINVNHLDFNGASFLEYAAKYGNENVIKLIRIK